MLSKNKSLFFQKKDFSVYFLNALEIRKIIRHYRTKNIEIIFNGHTNDGRQLIEKRRSDAILILDMLFDDRIKYALVNDRKSYKRLEANPQEFLNLNTRTPLYHLNAWLSSDDKKYLESEIDKKIQQNLAWLSSVCISKQEALQEMIKETSALRDEIKGYIFSNNEYSFQEHMEAFILLKNKIIKPIHWGSFGSENRIDHIDYPDMYLTNLLPWLPLAEKTHPLPQSQTNQGCGTFCVLYLKELLKDNAKQLHEFSLFFSYYDFKGILQHFFFPSPQILRYSESNCYNKIICALLAETDLTKFTHNNKNYEVVSLQRMLEHSIRKAEEKNDESLMKSNQELLSVLPDFRTKWNKAYASTEEKKLLMDLEDLNQYLAYSSQRMQRIANS